MLLRLALIVIVCALQTGIALAAPTVSEYESLTFGEMAITSNTVSTIVISTDGSESHGAGISPLLPGRNAVLRLMDFPANTLVSVMADNSTLDRRPSGPSFDITTFTFDPDPDHQVTGVDGKMLLKIGATLSTRAGTTYTAGPYRGTYNLMVSY